LSEFARQESENETSRADLARRIGRKPEQITRWLGSPGNWTLDTVSDLLLGMGLELGLSIKSISGEQTTNVMIPAIYCTANSSGAAFALAPTLIYDNLQNCHVDPQLYEHKDSLERIGTLTFSTLALTKP
jgi:hypothetical protein